VSTELGPDDLYRRCDPRDIPYDSTADARDAIELLGQERAVNAARFAIGIQRAGYNLFALSPEGIGKRTIVHQLLEREAMQQPVPPDWCCVFNFEQPHRPRALRLPPGTASRLRADMARAIAELRVAMPAAFDSDEYRSRRHQLVDAFTHRQEVAFKDLQQRAKARRVGVVRTDTGVGVAPLRGDSVIEPEEFARLPEREQAELRAAIEQVGNEVTALFHEFRDWVRQHHEAMEAFDREIAASVARRVIDTLRTPDRELPAVVEYLAQVERDVVDNVKRFVAKDENRVSEQILHALH
jgi:hypothetical protein